MDRLFAGPTDAEYASRLRLQQSHAAGFTGISIADLVARLRLTGGCSSGGSTFSIARQIYPTLKQFATVNFVKIYDPAANRAHGARPVVDSRAGATASSPRARSASPASPAVSRRRSTPSTCGSR